MRVVVYTQSEFATQPTVNGKDTTLAAATSNSDAEGQGVEYINMENGWIVRGLGWLVWAIIAGLNVYLIVMLCLGQS
jgi:Mn2+/Fe2+ NRAMP family transporter